MYTSIILLSFLDLSMSHCNMTWIVQWSKLDRWKGPSRTGESLLSPEYGKKSSFRKVVFSSFRINYDRQSKKQGSGVTRRSQIIRQHFFIFIYNLNQQSEFTLYKLMLWLLQCLDGVSSSGESPVPQIRSIGQFLLSRLFSSLTSSVLRSGFSWVASLVWCLLHFWWMKTIVCSIMSTRGCKEEESKN
jgi:hypothetical protein